jgi:hypothetical protein
MHSNAFETHTLLVANVEQRMIALNGQHNSTIMKTRFCFNYFYANKIIKKNHHIYETFKFISKITIHYKDALEQIYNKRPWIP